MPFYVASAMPKASLCYQPAGKPPQMFCTLLVLPARGCAPRRIGEAAMLLCGALHGTNFAVLVHVQKSIE
ncbi:hypothetical protein LZ683_25775 [Comamonas testosteroni]|uniref:hypothetical protein n=1 Tax=Comamonas testosteroni TaxID=285 RepID=UPI0023AB1F4D|nr:hypothetical protein [Comamonas testosteroni]WEE77505.1 hypothetical protein LZ683_25775 [Comamonas testosteroni]